MIEEKDAEKRSLWQTFARRRSKKGGHVKRNRRDNKIVVELERQVETPPNEALYRLHTLFPSAPNKVIQTVIKCSPHEEAAVFRLLHLGYAMRKLEDYKFLAYAGVLQGVDLKWELWQWAWWQAAHSRSRGYGQRLG